MLRKREKFERIDVPTPSRTRDIVSVVVIVVVFIGLIIGVSAAWRKAKSYAGFNDKVIHTAVGTQSKPEGFSGTQPSQNSITTVLFLTVTKDGTGLEGVRIAALNKTESNVAVANIPTDLSVTNESGTQAVSALCSASGAAACVEPLSSALSIKFTHVFIVQEGFWPALSAYASSDGKDDGVAMRAAVRSNLSNRKADAFINALVSAGIESAIASPVEVPTPVDARQLNLSLGLISVA